MNLRMEGWSTDHSMHAWNVNHWCVHTYVWIRGHSLPLLQGHSQPFIKDQLTLIEQSDTWLVYRLYAWSYYHTKKLRYFIILVFREILTVNRCGRYYLWLDLTKPGFHAQNFIRRYGDLSKHCLITLLYLWLCKQNLQQLFVYSLAIIVWVYKFLTQRICSVLGSFFRTGNNITGGSNRGGGWA